MSDWTEGYMADLEYTFGYYAELNPVRLLAPLLNVALAPPPIRSACELGFGQGISANVHAAASDVRWYGTDFNPAHAAFGRKLAAASGSDAQLFEQSFAEFCGRADLPDFDFIGLHGVWSWVTRENQAIIADFVRRKLNPGGVFYVSYNTMPGHASTGPVQHLLTRHAEIMGSPGTGIVARVDAALDFMDKLLAVNPTGAAALPSIAERLKLIKSQNRPYVAHEYFNREWRPMPFAEMAETLVSAKLSYAGSAHYLDHIDALNLTTDQYRLLGEIPDPIFRQSVRDFIMNQQFRRDYWVKGGQRLSTMEQGEALRRLKFVMTAGSRGAIPLNARGALGPRDLSPEIYNPIIDVFADHRPRTIGEAETALAKSNIGIRTIFETMMVFCGKGDFAPVQDETVQQSVKARTDKLNRQLLEKARSSGDVPVLASPVVGGGAVVSRIDQLFVLSLLQGGKGPESWAHFAWEVMAPQGQRMVKEGKPLETPEENLAALLQEAREFNDNRMPALRALQVI